MLVSPEKNGKISETTNGCRITEYMFRRKHIRQWADSQPGRWLGKKMSTEKKREIKKADI